MLVWLISTIVSGQPDWDSRHSFFGLSADDDMQDYHVAGSKEGDDAWFVAGCTRCLLFIFGPCFSMEHSILACSFTNQAHGVKRNDRFCK